MLEILHFPDATDEERTHALALLVGKASSQEAKAEQIARGVVEAACTLVQAPYAPVRANACLLLSKLLLLLEARRRLDREQLAALVGACTDADARTRKLACDALASFTLFADGAETLLEHPETVGALVAAIDTLPEAMVPCSQLVSLLVPVAELTIKQGACAARGRDSVRSVRAAPILRVPIEVRSRVRSR